MKCMACNYEYEGEKRDFENINENFLKFGTVTVGLDESGRYLYKDVYYCPKCGTVKVDV